MATPAGAATTWTIPTTVSHGPDCSAAAVTETSTAINNWINGLVPKVHPGDTIKLQPNTCYWTEGTILIHDFGGTASLPVTFDGNGSRFRSFNDAFGGRDRAHVKIQANGPNLIVKNLRVLGNGGGAYYAPLEAQHAFSIIGNNGVTLDNDVADGVYGDFVFLQKSSSGGVPTNITVQNSNFGANGTSGTARHEVTVDDGANVLFYQNYFAHAGRDDIDIEPLSTGNTLHDIGFQSNTFGPTSSGTYWFGNLGVAATITNLNFLFNTLNRPMTVNSVDPNAAGSTFPPTFKRTGYFFWGNYSTFTQADGACDSPNFTMRFLGTSGLTLADNTQPWAAGRCGYFVLSRNSTGTTIVRSTLSNANHVANFSNVTATCEGSNWIPPANPPSNLAPIDSGASLCAGYTG